jgi:hypothetical protein
MCSLLDSVQNGGGGCGKLAIMKIDSMHSEYVDTEHTSP